MAGRQPAPRRWRRWAPGVLLLCGWLVGGCIRTVELDRVEQAQDIRRESPLRTAANLPQAFTVLVPPRGSGDCPPRLRDPAAGVVLDLYRAMTVRVQEEEGPRFESIGDYRMTPPGHYGAASANDGLRINCARLSAQGLVSLGGAGS
jgi:hypothetical protein